MAIKRFTFDSILTRSFIQFGYDLYRGDANWIPFLRKDMETQLSQAFSFFQKEGNAHQHFLASSNGRIVGRISAMVNRELRNKDGSPVGTIGFFECIEDYAVVKDLFDAALSWLRGERRMTRVWGPMNFDIWHGYRLMTRGFETKIFYGEPYNKRYYPPFFETYGFSVKQHWDTVEVTGTEAIENIIMRCKGMYQQFVNRGYRFEPFNLHRFHGELKKLYRVLRQSFSHFLGMTTIPFAEFEELFSLSKYALHSKLFAFVYDETNTLVGFAGSFLELSDAVRLMQGNKGLIAFVNFLTARRRVNRVIFHMGGMIPDGAEDRAGLGRAGFYYIMRNILNEGYEKVIVALMASGNPVHGLLGRNIQPQRQYTLYEITL